MSSWNPKPELEPTRTPTAIDIAWAAGIYEGEGNIREQRFSSATIGVTQKDPELLYRLRDWFGGRVVFAQCKTIAPEKQVWAWRVCGDKARLFTAQIYGFLTARRKAQVDATHTLEFLGGASPVGLTIADLQARLEIFAASRLSTNPETVRKREQAKSQSWYLAKRAAARKNSEAKEMVN
jgi:hypothetical protein